MSASSWICAKTSVSNPWQDVFLGISSLPNPTTEAPQYLQEVCHILSLVAFLSKPAFNGIMRHKLKGSGKHQSCLLWTSAYSRVVPFSAGELVMLCHLG